MVIGDIIKKGNCGRDKARKMIAELVEFGYAEREQVREDGKFGSSVLVIFDEPLSESAPEDTAVGESVAFLPQTDLPATAMPSPVSPSPVKSAPSNNLELANTDSYQASAGAEEGLKRSDRKRIETEFTLWYATWKRGDIDYARNAWFALSDEERAECIERTPAYLRWAKPEDVRAAAVYLKNRMWREMPEEATAAPTRGIAKVCGKLWIGTRLVALSKEPTGRFVFTTFDEDQIAAGTKTREALLRSKRLEHGWPLVTVMRDLARRKEPFVTSLALLPAVAGFRQVKSDSALFAAWADLHERHGWPFIEHPNEYVWFPPVDENADDLNQAVEDALATFLSTISEAGNDDAA
ncbi:helix-turn-helix domain-containing protein [Rhizobium sp. A37_96]